MMYGREKSDSAIVAKKPANKTGMPAAEQVEPRAGTEGNAGQQRTRRAQNRESVSQKLDRVRQAAKLRKKERFTALLHHVTVEFLEKASMRFGAGRLQASMDKRGRTMKATWMNISRTCMAGYTAAHTGRCRSDDGSS
jgi:RNA-directed DNA polymerase